MLKSHCFQKFSMSHALRSDSKDFPQDFTRGAAAHEKHPHTGVKKILWVQLAHNLHTWNMWNFPLLCVVCQAPLCGYSDLCQWNHWHGLEQSSVRLGWCGWGLGSNLCHPGWSSPISGPPPFSLPPYSPVLPFCPSSSPTLCTGHSGLGLYVTSSTCAGLARSRVAANVLYHMFTILLGCHKGLALAQWDCALTCTNSSKNRKSIRQATLPNLTYSMPWSNPEMRRWSCCIINIQEVFIFAIDSFCVELASAHVHILSTYLVHTKKSKHKNSLNGFSTSGMCTTK